MAKGTLTRPGQYRLCLACGEHITWLDTLGMRPQPYGPDGKIHVCVRNVALKIYSEEEKRDFERRRLRGEV